MNGLISLISTVAGAALFFHKNKDVDAKGGNTKTDTSTLDPTESSYQEYKQKVEEAQAQQQANDPRNKTMYLGSPTAPYDAFYDYSNDRVYNTPSSVKNLEDKFTANACRARLVSPYLLSQNVERIGVDDSNLKVLSVIGSSPDASAIVKNTFGGSANFFKRYFEPDLYIPTATIGGQIKYVATQARGNFRYVTFYVEIFNPCDREIELQMCGVSNIRVGETKCQPVHIGGDLPYGEDFTMGENEMYAKHYMYDGADYNILDRGNKWWHAARDLQVEPFQGGKSVECKWKEMTYPYMLCDNIFNNGYSNQNWGDIAAGLYKFRTGTQWATYDKEKSREKNYEPNYLKIDSMSSAIVKMTLPLASMDDTKVYYVPEGELFDWDFRKGKIERLFSSIGVPDSEFANFSPQKLAKIKINGGRDLVYYSYYTLLHNKGISDYLRFDFKSAPSLNGKTFEIKLELVNKIEQFYPKGDKDLVNQDSDVHSKSFELKFIPTARPTSMANVWQNSYIDDRSIPDESQPRSVQLGLIQKKFNYAYEDTINEAFDASANN